MLAADNPFRLIYTALWDMLEASAAFTAEVGTGNRIRQDGTTPRYVPDAFAEADLPSVRLRLAGHKPGLQATSDSSLPTTTWVIEVHTGDVRFLTALDVNWAILRAMLGWETSLRDALTWEGKAFVHLCRPLEVQEQIDDKGRGNRGWVAVWRGEVQMNFTTSDLEE